MKIGFDVVAAKPKGEVLHEDAPVQEPMAPRRDRTSPSTDQKKVRRRTASQESAPMHKSAQEMSFQEWMAAIDSLVTARIGLSVHDLPDMDFRSMYDDGMPADEETLLIMLEDSGQDDVAMFFESHLIRHIARSGVEDQRRLVAFLETMRERRRAAIEESRGLDFGAAVVAAVSTPSTVFNPHTGATDWLLEDDRDDTTRTAASSAVQRKMAGAASAWYQSLLPMVREDPEEYRVQAQGAASVAASDAGIDQAVATDAFVRHALFLNRGKTSARKTALWFTIGEEFTGAPEPKHVVRRFGDEFVQGFDSRAEAESYVEQQGGRIGTPDSGTEEGWPFQSAVAPTVAHADTWVSPFIRRFQEASLAEEPPHPWDEKAGTVSDDEKVEGEVKAEVTDEEDTPWLGETPVAPENAAAVAQEGERTPMPGLGEEAPDRRVVSARTAALDWTKHTAPSGAVYYRASKDGYTLDARPLLGDEGEPGWWGWSVTGDGANGPRNRHGQAANRDEAEQIALGIVENAHGFTLESGRLSSRRTAFTEGVDCPGSGDYVEGDFGGQRGGIDGNPSVKNATCPKCGQEVPVSSGNYLLTHLLPGKKPTDRTARRLRSTTVASEKVKKVKWNQQGDYWSTNEISGWVGTVEARSGGYKWTSVMNGVVLGSGMEPTVGAAKTKAMDAMGGDFTAAKTASDTDEFAVGDKVVVRGGFEDGLTGVIVSGAEGGLYSIEVTIPESHRSNFSGAETVVPGAFPAHRLEKVSVRRMAERGAKKPEGMDHRVWFDTVACDKCAGKGWIDLGAGFDWTPVDNTCPKCKGSGLRSTTAVRRTASRKVASGGGLGFTKVEAADLDVEAILQAINAAAADRGLRLDIPSDELDLSRDLMLDEAMASIGARWDIKGDTLRVWPKSWDAWPVKASRKTAAAREFSGPTMEAVVQAAQATMHAGSSPSLFVANVNGVRRVIEVSPPAFGPVWSDLGSYEDFYGVTAGKAASKARTCKHCGEEIEWAGGNWIEVRSGDEGGTYDICPDAPTSNDDEDGRHSPTQKVSASGVTAGKTAMPRMKYDHEAKPSSGSKESALQATAAARPLYEIAAEIKADWGGKVYFGAVPYLDAMGDLNSISDQYGMDSAKSIVAYFLSNATTWRGETARRVKKELKGLLDGRTASTRRMAASRKTAALDVDEIPADYPVQPVSDGFEAPPNVRVPDEINGGTKAVTDYVTCGTCGLTWDDSIVTGMTPAPAARCPFESFHDDIDATSSRRTAVSEDVVRSLQAGDTCPRCEKGTLKSEGGVPLYGTPMPSYLACDYCWTNYDPKNGTLRTWARLTNGTSKKASADTDGKVEGEVVVGDPVEEEFSPWVLPTQVPSGAAAVAGTPTPGGQSGYPQPKTAATSVPLSERQALVGQNVTLNGEPARISGYKNDYATVRQVTRDGSLGLSAEWAWETVKRIVEEKGGAFTASRRTSAITNPHRFAAFRERVQRSAR